MTKFILHGGYEREDNELNISFWNETVLGLSDGDTLLLVYFSRRGNKKEVLDEYYMDKNLLRKHHVGRKINYVQANEEHFLEQIKKTKAIHVFGGDTNKLISTLKKFPEFPDLIRGKTISGSSAGAYAISTLYYSCSRGGIHEGLGLLPIKVVAHYQSKKWPSQTNPIEEMNKIAPELELVVLKDYEWKVFNA